MKKINYYILLGYYVLLTGLMAGALTSCADKEKKNDMTAGEAAELQESPTDIAGQDTTSLGELTTEARDEIIETYKYRRQQTKESFSQLRKELKEVGERNREGMEIVIRDLEARADRFDNQMEKMGNATTEAFRKLDAEMDTTIRNIENEITELRERMKNEK